jgi:oligopeptidase B
MLDSSIHWVEFEFQEWGNPKNETFFHYMKSYDPYESITNTNYPNVLIQSGIFFFEKVIVFVN